ALSKSDRKKEAMRFVNDQLKANGFDLDYQVIAGLVEKAYQAYKATGADNHFAPVTPAPVESENSQSTKSIDATGNVSQTSQPTEKGDLNA
ncbi:hypothetical protein EFP86_15605, partial [Lentilactobacillus hilgardii]|nr:hypothetical protein [Lentilactobacillus hilgardii]